MPKIGDFLIIFKVSGGNTYSNMAQKDMFLFWGSGSAPCWKAMIALEEKSLSGYGQRVISFKEKEHKCDDIMKLNPRGQVSLRKAKIKLPALQYFANSFFFSSK